jgi:hypothetical protein
LEANASIDRPGTVRSDFYQVAVRDRESNFVEVNYIFHCEAWKTSKWVVVATVEGRLNATYLVAAFFFA